MADEHKPTAPGEATRRERELARILDGALLAIEETSETLEEHSDRNQAMLSEQFAAYRKELAGNPEFLLPAVESLLRAAGIAHVALVDADGVAVTACLHPITMPTMEQSLVDTYRSFCARKERIYARHH